MPAKKVKKLTAKQEDFCLHYAECLDATKAAKLAGYSEKSPSDIGYQQLQKPLVQQRIAKLREGKAKKVHISIDMILGELWKIANADISEAYNEDGTLKPIHEIPEHLRKAISGIETYTEFTESDEPGKTKGTANTKVKFWSKTQALDLLGKHLGAWIEKTQNTNVNVNVDLTDTESETFQKVKRAILGEEPVIDVKPIPLKAHEEME